MKKILKSKIFWVIFVILIIGTAFIVRSVNQGSKIEYVTEQAKIDNIVQTVSATGQVKSASEIELNFRNTGRVVVLNVDTGDQVSKGDVLTQLKATDLAIAVSRAQADLLEAQASLDKVVAGATGAEIAVAQAAVQKAQSDLSSAQADAVNTEKTYRQTLENQRASIVVIINSALTKAGISEQKVYDALNYEGDDDNFIAYNNQLQTKVETDYYTGVDKIDQATSLNQAANSDQTDEKIDAAVAAALDALNFTKSNVDDLSKLLDYVVTNSALTQSELDALKIVVNTERTTTDTSINNVETAKQNLVDARINYQTKVNAAQNAVKVAEKNLTKAQADLDLKRVAARPEDVAVYRARVQRAQADLALAQDNYSDTIIKAPIDGVITEVNYEVGEQTSLAKPMIKMLAVEDHEIDVDIPESDISKIEVGDQAKITLDAFTDNDIFLGDIATINPAQTEMQDVVYYKVTVGLVASQPESVRDLQSKIKPGMTANIDIETASREGVLVIPTRAVKDKNGQMMVDVLENGQVKAVSVSLGLRGDDGLVEITSGLIVGQEVITFTKNGK